MAQQWTSSFTVLELGQVDLAVWLQVRISQQMTFHVLVQVTLLREGKLAVLLHGVWARVRSLIGVDPQVVIEIVPLSEVHWAVRVIALQDFEISLGLWVLEFEYPKHLGRRDVRVRLFLIYFQLLVQADFAALDDLDLIASQWNLVQDTLVLDLIARENKTLLLMLVGVALTVKSSATAG